MAAPASPPVSCAVARAVRNGMFPGLRRSYLPGVALGIAVLANLLGGGFVVVMTEAARQPEAAVEDPRGHEPGGRIAAGREGRGQGGHVLGEHGRAVVAQSMLGWNEAG